MKGNFLRAAGGLAAGLAGVMAAVIAVNLVLFGFAVSTEVHHVRVDIVGDMQDPAVRQIANRIDQNPYLRIAAVYESPIAVSGGSASMS